MTVSARTAQVGNAADRRGPAGSAALSTDFLNRFNEALMLIEIAAMDETIVEDLRNWTNVGYREHFQSSSLRCAGSALAAYENLAPHRRAAFEDTCSAMARLIRTMTDILCEKPLRDDLPEITAVASDALRKLISRSTQFINANGTIDLSALPDRTLQAEIDALIAYGSA